MCSCACVFHSGLHRHDDCLKYFATAFNPATASAATPQLLEVPPTLLRHPSLYGTLTTLLSRVRAWSVAGRLAARAHSSISRTPWKGPSGTDWSTAAGPTCSKPSEKHTRDCARARRDPPNFETCGLPRYACRLSLRRRKEGEDSAQNACDARPASVSGLPRRSAAAAASGSPPGRWRWPHLPRRAGLRPPVRSPHCRHSCRCYMIGVHCPGVSAVPILYEFWIAVQLPTHNRPKTSGAIHTIETI